MLHGTPRSSDWHQLPVGSANPFFPSSARWYPRCHRIRPLLLRGSRLASCFGQYQLNEPERTEKSENCSGCWSFLRGRTAGCRDFRVKARQTFFVGPKPVIEVSFCRPLSPPVKDPLNSATSRRLRENHSARESRGVWFRWAFESSWDHAIHGRSRCF